MTSALEDDLRIAAQRLESWARGYQSHRIHMIRTAAPEQRHEAIAMAAVADAAEVQKYAAHIVGLTALIAYQRNPGPSGPLRYSVHDDPSVLSRREQLTDLPSGKYIVVGELAQELIQEQIDKAKG